MLIAAVSYNASYRMAWNIWVQQKYNTATRMGRKRLAVAAEFAVLNPAAREVYKMHCDGSHNNNKLCQDNAWGWGYVCICCWLRPVCV